jgi:hypothetical protein
LDHPARLVAPLDSDLAQVASNIFQIARATRATAVIWLEAGNTPAATRAAILENSERSLAGSPCPGHAGFRLAIRRVLDEVVPEPEQDNG